MVLHTYNPALEGGGIREFKAEWDWVLSRNQVRFEGFSLYWQNKVNHFPHSVFQVRTLRFERSTFNNLQQN